jgi:Domain of unknown function (DUF4386)
MDPTDRKARTAGAVYLALTLIAPLTMMYIPAKLIVHGNATATAENVIAHETLFRIGIVAGLFTSVIFILLGLALYRLLSGVNKPQAFLMITFVLVSAAVAFVNELNNVAALNFAGGSGYLAVFEKPQRDALAMFFLQLHNQGQFINEIFWGLWLLPFGLLVYRSGFLPRLLGVWLILNCLAYLILSVIALVAPDQYDTAFRLATPVCFGEIAILLWFLIKGAGGRGRCQSLLPEPA